MSNPKSPLVSSNFSLCSQKRPDYIVLEWFGKIILSSAALLWPQIARRYSTIAISMLL